MRFWGLGYGGMAILAFFVLAIGVPWWLDRRAEANERETYYVALRDWDERWEARQGLIIGFEWYDDRFDRVLEELEVIEPPKGMAWDHTRYYLVHQLYLKQNRLKASSEAYQDCYKDFFGELDEQCLSDYLAKWPSTLFLLQREVNELVGRLLSWYRGDAPYR